MDSKENISLDTTYEIFMDSAEDISIDSKRHRHGLYKRETE